MDFFIGQLQHAGALRQVGLWLRWHGGVEQGQTGRHFVADQIIRIGRILCQRLLGGHRCQHLFAHLFPASAGVGHDALADQPGIGCAAFAQQRVGQGAFDAAFLL